MSRRYVVPTTKNCSKISSLSLSSTRSSLYASARASLLRPSGPDASSLTFSTTSNWPTCPRATVAASASSHSFCVFAGVALVLMLKPICSSSKGRSSVATRGISISLRRNVVRTFSIIASKISFDPEPVCSSSSSPSSERSLNKLCTAQASSYSLRSDGDNSNAFSSASLCPSSVHS